MMNPPSSNRTASLADLPVELLLHIGRFLPHRLGLPLNRALWYIFGSPSQIAHRAIAHHGVDHVLISEAGRIGTGVDIVAKLLEDPVIRTNVNRVIAGNTTVRSALKAAALAGNLQVCELLIDFGAHIVIRDPAEHSKSSLQPWFRNQPELHLSAIIEAAGGGHLNVVQMMVLKRNVLDIEMERAMVRAASKDHWDVVFHFLDRGVNVNSTDDFLLRRAVHRGQNVGLVERLLRRGANVHSCDNYCLLEATRNDALEMVALLLANGASVTAQGGYMVQKAVEANNFAMVEILLQHGADIHWSNYVALHLAIRSGRLDIVKLLLKAGADAGASHGALFRMAIDMGRFDIADLLVKYGGEGISKRLYAK